MLLEVMDIDEVAEPQPLEVLIRHLLRARHLNSLYEMQYYQFVYSWKVFISQCNDRDEKGCNDRDIQFA